MLRCCMPRRMFAVKIPKQDSCKEGKKTSSSLYKQTLLVGCSLLRGLGNDYSALLKRCIRCCFEAFRPLCDDDRMIALVLSEEYANIDGAVARRLSNLAPVPHVPWINSYIPNVSDASMDHQRLIQRPHSATRQLKFA